MQLHDNLLVQLGCRLMGTKFMFSSSASATAKVWVPKVYPSDRVECTRRLCRFLSPTLLISLALFC